MKFLLPVTVISTLSLLASNVEARWKPTPGLTWNYVLGNDINISIEKADVVEVDVNKSAAKIQSYHDAGKKVICYFSGGTIEDFRDDYDQFVAIKGLVKNYYDEWPEEQWLDIRMEELKPLIKKRMEIAVSKKCDGIEVDNLDGYQISEVKSWKNPLTKQDAIRYATWLGTTAHSLGISIGLKNVLGIIDEVGNYFDFAINEECIDYNECYLYKNFIKSGKAVFGVTYNGLSKNKEALCRNLDGLGMSMIIKPGLKLIQDGIIFNGKEHCGANFNTGISGSVASNPKATTSIKKTTTTIKKVASTTSKKAVTTTIKKVATTTPVKKVASTTSKKAVTTTIKKVASTTSKKVVATTPAKKTTTSKKVSTVKKVVKKVVKVVTKKKN